MNRNDALLFCQRWLPLWTGNQPERLIEVYSEDVFYRDPAKPDGITGKANLLAYLRKQLVSFPEWVWEAEDVFPIEGGFALRWKATIPLGDAVIRETGMDLVLVQDGKVIRNEVYFDRAALLAAMSRASGARS